MRQSSAVAFRAPVLIPPSTWLSLEEAAILDNEIAEDHIALDKAEMEVVRLTDVHDSMSDVQSIVEEAPSELAANQMLVDAVGVMAACGDEAAMELGEIAVEDMKEDLGNKLAALWKAIKEAMAKMWEHLKALVKKLRLKFSATYRHQEEVRKKWEEYDQKLDAWKKADNEFWKRYNATNEKYRTFLYKGDVSKLVRIFDKPGTVISRVATGVEELVNDVILLRQHLIGGFTHMGRLIEDEVADFLTHPYTNDTRFKKGFKTIIDYLLGNARGMILVDGPGNRALTTKNLHLGGIAITMAEGFSELQLAEVTMDQILNFDLKVERNEPGSRGHEATASMIPSETKDVILKASNKWWEAMSSASSISEMEKLEQMSSNIDKRLDQLIAKANRDDKKTREAQRHAQDLIKAANMYARLVVKVMPKLTSHVDDVVDASLGLADKSLVVLSDYAQEIAEVKATKTDHPTEPANARPKK